jgi:hypothetical protein
MPARKLRIVIVIYCALSSLLTAQSRLALVIGNGAYADAASHEAAASAPEHARHVADALVKRGFEVLLGTDLTGAEMDKALERFAGRLAGPDAFGIVYYSGRDSATGGRLSLLPVDATSAEGAFLFAKLLAAMGKARGAVLIDSSSDDEAAKAAGDAFLSELAGLPVEKAPFALYARGECVIAEALARTLEAPMPGRAALRQLKNEAALSGDGPTPIIARGEPSEGFFMPEAAQGSVADLRGIETISEEPAFATKKPESALSLLTGYNAMILEPQSTLDEVLLGIATSPSDSFTLKFTLAYLKYQNPNAMWEALAIAIGFELRFPIADIVAPYVGLDLGPLIGIGNGLGGAAPFFAFLEAGMDIKLSKNLSLGFGYYWFIKSLIGARIQYTL